MNDTHGHAAGDEVLVGASGRMQGCVRAGDVVARFGGDEFVVLLEPLDEEASAVAVADRLVAALAEPLLLRNGHEVSIGASVGVAIAQDGAVDPERVLMEADVAVYRAKVAGRGRAEVFDTSLREELDRRHRLQDGLLHAIEAGALELRHEPVVDLRTRRLAGYEAKVSWPRAGEDELDRSAILPVAERTELVCDLDTWALREAVRQAASIPADSSPAMLAVPLSGRHLRRPRVVGTSCPPSAPGSRPNGSCSSSPRRSWPTTWPSSSTSPSSGRPAYACASRGSVPTRVRPTAGRACPSTSSGSTPRPRPAPRWARRCCA